MTLHADDEIVDLGRLTRLSGAVAGPAPCRSGAAVRILRRIGATVEQVDSALTDESGGWAAGFRSNRNAAYFAEVPAGGGCASATSEDVVVKVRAAVDGFVRDGRIDRGGCARVRGEVSPNKPGDRVRLQVETSRGWRSIDSDALDSRSRFSFPACFDRAGRKTLRVRWPGDPANAAGTSSRMRVRVTR